MLLLKDKITKPIEEFPSVVLTKTGWKEINISEDTHDVICGQTIGGVLSFFTCTIYKQNG